MGQSRRIKVKGVQKAEGPDIEMLSLIFWLQAKRQLAERRQRAAKAKAKKERRER